MSSIADNIRKVWQRIELAQKKGGNTNPEVQLLAISKTKPPELIREAYHSGVRNFGENYLQEALVKMDALADLPICWHFTGPIQSNKTRIIANRFSWVHSVDRFKIAERLSSQREDSLPPLNICIQVNLHGEDTKSGISETELFSLAEAISKMPNLTIRGLMSIPPKSLSQDELHTSFANIRILANRLSKTVPTIDTLSIGMSRDLEVAISEGATMVRIGTDIFGSREKANHVTS